MATRHAPGVRTVAWLATLATLATLALAAGPVAGAAGISLRNAWMRPAPAGAAAARVYIDIDSDDAVDLVAATTPAARKVEIVRTATIGDPATERVVAAYAVAAHETTRLAYRGDHLRLVSLTRDAHNGAPVPLVLVFRDAAGRRFDVATEITVRGLLLPQSTPAAPPAATTAR